VRDTRLKNYDYSIYKYVLLQKEVAMKKIMKELKPAFVCLLIFTILCGVVYTGVITMISQAFFNNKANGSIITITLKDGTDMKIGSELIAQEFTKPEYLIGRPLGTSNKSSTSDELQQIVDDRIKWWHNLDPKNSEDIPSDLVYGSGSGVDPNISIKAAQYQVTRIANARGLSEDEVKDIISKYTTGRFLGIFGEPVVNVLKVNLELDGKL
jgi:K+-transporting ATPase ATPase C chain